MRCLVACACMGAVLAGAALATAETHPSGHYVGRASCGAGSATCPKQNGWVLLKVGAHQISKFTADVTCRQGPTGPTGMFGDETLTHVKIDSQGNFHGRTPPSPYTEQLKIHGHVAGDRIKGKIDYSDNQIFNTEPDTPACEAHGVGFTAKFHKKPLFKPGKYSGVTHCSAPASNHCNAAQSNTITFTATKYAIKNGSTVMGCTDANGMPYTHSTAFNLPISWNGVFEFRSTSKPDTSVALGGRISGTHAKGRLFYDGSEDGSRCFVGFNADRVP